MESKTGEFGARLPSDSNSRQHKAIALCYRNSALPQGQSSVEVQIKGSEKSGPFLIQNGKTAILKLKKSYKLCLLAMRS
jgi:hypothetical protein